jgi:hypothetical protein
VGGVWLQSLIAGTYSGNMSGRARLWLPGSGGGSSVTTFSGTTTLTGWNYIDGATLSVQASGSADNGEVQIGGGTLDVAETETIGTLNDGLFWRHGLSAVRRRPDQ